MGGEAGSVAGELGSANKYVQASFSTMRLIVTAGWSIYPAGYFFGYLMGGVNDCSLNLIYNLADFVNKIAFCLAIWQAAKNETLALEVVGIRPNASEANCLDFRLVDVVACCNGPCLKQFHHPDTGTRASFCVTSSVAEAC